MIARHPLKLLGVLAMATPGVVLAENEQFFEIDSDRSRIVYRRDDVQPAPPDEVLPISGFVQYSEANEGYVFPVVWVRPRSLSPVQASEHEQAFGDGVFTPRPFYFPSYILRHEVEGEFGATNRGCNSFNWRSPRHGSCLGFDLHPGETTGLLADGVLTLSGVDPIDFQYEYAFEIYAEAIDHLPGDADEDGFITPSDLGVLHANYGAADATRGDGDLNGDTIVDAADYTVWRDSFYGELSPSATVTTPEPSSIVMASLLLAAAARSTRGALRGLARVPVPS